MKNTFHEPKTYDIEILLNVSTPKKKRNSIKRKISRCQNPIVIFFGPKFGNEKAQIIINLII